jgi:hypothetical protein
MSITFSPHCPPARRRGPFAGRRATAAGLTVAVVLAGLAGIAPAHADDEPASLADTGTTTTTVAPDGPDEPAGPPPTTGPAPTTTTAPAGRPPAAPPTTGPAPTAPPPPARRYVIAYPSQIANILATIRYVESRGNYAAPPNKGNASGAYQFIASTWDGYGGYDHAYLAPPEIQDERAALDVERFLEQWDNDVSMVPVMWYYPRAARDAALLDVVPVPSAGNILTVREYQQRWLGVWAFLSGQPIPPTLTLADALARMGIPPEVPEPQPVAPGTPAVERKATISYPVLGPSRIAAPDCGDADDVTSNAGATGSPEEVAAAGLCAEEAPSIVFGVKLQPVLSVTNGVVTEVVDEPGETISVTVTDVTGRSFRLDGFNDDTPGTDDGNAPPHLRLGPLARVGTTVRAGQVLGFMGNSSELPIGIRADVPTDRSVTIDANGVAPHVRLTINDLDGTPVDAYGPVLDALFRQACHVATGPWASFANGSGHTPVTIETTDDDRDIDSEWVVDDQGRVFATGWAAMIYPSESCAYTPADTHGPGAGGSNEVPDSWWSPIDLPTSTWIRLADDRTDDAVVRVVRP